MVQRKIAKIPLPPFQLKQPDAISGNISIFGSDVNLGQVIDSGYSINDSLPPSSQVIWSSNQVQSQLLAVSQAKQPNANAGNLAIFGNGVNNGQAIDSGYSINDLSAPSSNVCIQVVKFHKFFNHKCLFFQVYLLHLQLILRLIFYMLVLMDHLMFGMVLCIIMLFVKILFKVFITKPIVSSSWKQHSNPISNC